MRSTIQKCAQLIGVSVLIALTGYSISFAANTMFFYLDEEHGLVHINQHVEEVVEPTASKKTTNQEQTHSKHMQESKVIVKAETTIATVDKASEPLGGIRLAANTNRRLQERLQHRASTDVQDTIFNLPASGPLNEFDNYDLLEQLIIDIVNNNIDKIRESSAGGRDPAVLNRRRGGGGGGRSFGSGSDNPLEVVNGGTGLNNIRAGELIYGADENVYATLGLGNTGTVLIPHNGRPAWSSSLFLNGTLNAKNVHARDFLSSSGTLKVHQSGTFLSDVSIAGNTTIDKNLTVSGTIFTSLEPGSVVFVNGSGALSDDFLDFFWDEDNDFLGLGTNTPDARIEIVGTASGTHIVASQTLRSSGTLKTDGNAQFGTGILADTTNVRLGIGTLAPETELEVIGTVSGSVISTPLLQADTVSGNIIVAQTYLGSSGALRVAQTGTLLSGLDVAARATLKGNVDIGDAATDTLTVNAQIDSHLIPNEDAVYNLGSSTLRWKDLFVSSGSIHLGEDGDEAIFSYNTTDNVVELDRGLHVQGTVSGSALHADTHITASGNIAVSGNANFDSDTLVVDSTNNRVGIGESAPSHALQVDGHIRADRFRAANGTAGDPAFKFHGDTDTGIFSTGTNSIGITTGGSEALRIDSSGNVVIGNTSADTELEVVGTISGTTLFASDLLSTSGNLLVAGTSSFGLVNADTLSGNTITATSFLGSSGSLKVTQTGTFLSGIEIAGLGKFTGDVEIGDASTDTVTFNARIDSDLIPSVNDTYSLGSSTSRWKDIFVNSGSIHIGADGDEGVISYNTINNEFVFDQSLSVQGTVSGSQLHAEGDITASGDLIVSGTATFNGGLEGTGDIETTGTISGSIVHASSQLTSSGTLSVAGNANLGNGTMFIDSAMNVVGIGTVDLETALEVAGTISGSVLHASDLLSTSGALLVAGTATFQGDVFVQGTLSGLILHASSQLTSSGTLSVADDTSIGGDLTIEGLAAFGTDTLTGATMVIATDDVDDQLSLYIDSGETDANQDIFRIDSDVQPGSGSTVAKFRIEADGDVFADGDIFANSVSVGGADYAEWIGFNTQYGNWKPGDVLCQHPGNVNQVSLCTIEASPNVIGVVTTKPGVLGGTPGEGKVKMAFFGQIPVNVEGIIEAGDWLTNAGVAGLARKAEDGEPTIGRALTGNRSGRNTEVRMILSRNNNSISVAGVESRIYQELEDRGIGEDLSKSIAQSIEDLQLDETISLAVEEGIEAIDLSKQITDIVSSSLPFTNGSWSDPLTFQKTLEVQGDVTFNESLKIVAALNAGSISVEENSTFLKDLNVQGALSAKSLSIASDATVGGTLSVGAIIIDGTPFDPNALTVPEPVDIAKILAEDSLKRIGGDIEFEGNVSIAGHLSLNKDQGGYLTITKGQHEIRHIFDKEFTEPPIITASSNQFVLWRIKEYSKHDFILQTASPVAETTTFHWHAFVAKDAKQPEEQDDNQESGNNDNGATEKIAFYVNSTHKPVPQPNANDEVKAWFKRCVDNITEFDATGKAIACRDKDGNRLKNIPGYPVTLTAVYNPDVIFDGKAYLAIKDSENQYITRVIDSQPNSSGQNENNEDDNQANTGVDEGEAENDNRGEEAGGENENREQGSKEDTEQTDDEERGGETENGGDGEAGNNDEGENAGGEQDGGEESAEGEDSGDKEQGEDGNNDEGENAGGEQDGGEESAEGEDSGDKEQGEDGNNDEGENTEEEQSGNEEGEASGEAQGENEGGEQGNEEDDEQNDDEEGGGETENDRGEGGDEGPSNTGDTGQIR